MNASVVRFDLPTTIVAGYLGSGKTSHINRLLNNQSGTRYAVMVNDFGDLNIDVDLIAKQSKLSISLSNGCVCCNISAGLAPAFETIREQAENIDWVLFEASGVADPTRLSAIVENAPGFSLVDTLTLVDVTRIRQLVNDKFIGGHIRKQIDEAQSVQLSKLDLVDEHVEKDVRQWLLQRKVIAPASAMQPHGKFYHQGLQQLKSMSKDVFLRFVDKQFKKVARVKGVVYLDNERLPYVFQGVEGVFELSQCDSADVGTGKLLLIDTQKLDVDLPVEEWQYC